MSFTEIEDKTSNLSKFIIYPTIVKTTKGKSTFFWRCLASSLKLLFELNNPALKKNQGIKKKNNFPSHIYISEFSK